MIEDGCQYNVHGINKHTKLPAKLLYQRAPAPVVVLATLIINEEIIGQW
jgi:hypothetical protein